jgi:arabinofuranosyltransferase
MCPETLKRFIPGDGRDRRFTLVLACCALLLGTLAFVALAVRLFPYTMDDAFISFRYASNLAQGKGLVFNPSEPLRAEGITSPLYAAILGLAALTGQDIEAFSKWLGLLAVFVTSVLVWAVVSRLLRSLTSLPHVSVAMVCSCVAAYFLTDPYRVATAVSGMETSLAALALCGFLFLLLKMMSSGTPPTRREVALTGIAATLVPMFRPEMVLFVVFVLAASALMSGRDRRPVLSVLAFSVLLGALYYVLRFAYYGLPLPLPFYIKQADLGNLKGLNHVGSYLRFVGLLLPFCFVCLAFAMGPHRREQRRLSAYLLAASVALVAQLAYYVTIRPTMGLGFRFLQPTAVALVILSFVGVGILYGVALESRIGTWFSLPLFFCALGMALAASNVSVYRSAREIFIDWYPRIASAGATIGRSLKAASGGTSLSMAIYDCGRVPFYSGLPVIDLAGLNNRAIALGRTSEAARGEIGKRKPNLVVLVAKNKHDPSSLYGWEGLNGEDMQALGYCYTGTLTIGTVQNGDGYYYLVYSNGDSSTGAFLGRLALTGVLEPAPVDVIP